MSVVQMATGDYKSMCEDSNDEINYGHRRTKNTCFGVTKTFDGLTCAEKAFCIISILNILAALILSIIQFISVIDSGNVASDDYNFSLLLIFNGGCAAFYAVHGLLREKSYELFAFVLATLLVLVYCIVDIAVNVEGRSVLKWLRLVLAIYLFLSNFGFAFCVNRGFGKIANIVAGALQWKLDVYHLASLFYWSLAFDAQIAVCFMILVLKDGGSFDMLQVVMFAIGIPYSVSWYFFAIYIVYKQETEKVKYFVWIGVLKLLFFLAFLIYKFVKISSQTPEADTEKEESGCVIEYSRMVAGFFGIFIWILIVVVIKRLSKHFDQGLDKTSFGFSQETEITGILQSRPT